MGAHWRGAAKNTQIKSVKQKETKSQIQFKNESVSPLLHIVTVTSTSVALGIYGVLKEVI